MSSTKCRPLQRRRFGNPERSRQGHESRRLVPVGFGMHCGAIIVLRYFYANNKLGGDLQEVVTPWLPFRRS